MRFPHRRHPPSAAGSRRYRTGAIYHPTPDRRLPHPRYVPEWLQYRRWRGWSEGFGGQAAAGAAASDVMVTVLPARSVGAPSLPAQVQVSPVVASVAR